MSWWRSRSKEQKIESGKPLIVVADDELDICNVMRLALEAHGYEVATANDGEAALALVRARLPRLVILDIKMPKMNGFQVLVAMQTDEVLCQIPVIVMTSLTDSTDASEEEWAGKLGVHRLVTKPADPETVLRVVREVLAPAES